MKDSRTKKTTKIATFIRESNLPNVLTTVRTLLAFVLPFILVGESLTMRLLAGFVFFIAAITDYYDGMLARKYNLITLFGKILDPIADKLLTLGAFTTLYMLDMFPLWILIPILFREVAVTVLRFYFLYKGKVVAAVKSGKLKTVLQFMAIVSIYINLLVKVDFAPMLSMAVANPLSVFFKVVMYILLFAALYQTLYSGFDFLKKNWKLLTGRKWA